MTAAEQLERMGITVRVRRWLHDHERDPVREEIVALFMKTIDEGFPQEKVLLLRSKIAKITPT